MTDGVTLRSGQGRPGSIVEALNHEWCRLDRDRGGAAVRWAQHHSVLSGCRSLEEILAVVRSHSDPALSALLAEVATGDQLAGRVVLQSMIGRMVRMSERDRSAGVDDYIAALWCRIVEYPLDRRPRRIFANLALDTLKSVLRERRWLVRGEVTPWPPGEFFDQLVDRDHPQVTAAVCEMDDVGAPEVLAAALALNLIDQTTRAVLTSVYVDGLSGSEAADRHGTSAGAVRVRCCTAVHRLSRSRPALLAAG